MRRRFIKIFPVFCLLTAAMLFAQTQQGRIVGRVTDSTGAVLKGATVTVENLATGEKRVLATNEAGDYAAPYLNPGNYKLTVEAPNFKTVERQNIVIEVATDVRIDMVLSPGAASEVVQVTAEQPLVETLNDVLGGTITNKQITELPLLGRDFQNLLELRPGVQRTPGGGFHSVTSNGNRPDDNNFFIDGANDNDVYYGETVINAAGVQGTPASHLPLDAIQEFNTQENQGSDYGWKPGVVVNLGLKSGGNQFHGTGYYFHRNNAFDARNYFNPYPDQVASVLLHQFGGSLGGPIVKDKLFFFATYEGVRDRVGNPYNVSSPVTVSLANAANPLGNPDISIPDAINGCLATPGCTPNPLSLQVAKIFLPNPGPNELIDFDFDNKNREDNAIFKLDYRVNDHNTLSGRFVYGNSDQTEEDTNALAPQFLSLANTRASVMGVNWTYAPNSSWVNEARFGYNRFWQKLYPVDHNVDPTTGYGINTGITDPSLFGLPRINISPFNYLGGNSSWPLFTTPNITYQFLDNVTYTHGNHSIRFGGEFRYGHSDYLRDTYGRGRIRFSSLEDFVAGIVRPNSFGGGNLLVGDTHRLLSLTAIGGFIQDDWRVRRNLTLNIGLRYDLSFPIKEAHDQLANFLPNQGIIQVGHGINSIYPLDKNNFSPRLGIAWDVFGTGKTVLRGGGAIIFEQPSIRNFVNAGGVNNNPSSAAAGVTPGTGNINVFTLSLDSSQINWTGSALAGSGSQPIFNTALAGTCDPGDPCTIAGISPTLSTPYVASWNLNLEQQIARNTVLQVGYVGNHGIKLYSHRDINQVVYANDDGSEQFGRPFTFSCPGPVGGGAGGPCYPYVGFMDYIENKANSFYHALQSTLTTRNYHGLNILAGYTWAHAIDTATSNLASVPQNSFNYAGDRGNADYDIRNRFTVSITYEVPEFKAPWQMGKGWTLTSIVNLQAGEPVSFYDSSDDISGTGEGNDRWNFTGNPSDVHFSPAGPSFNYVSYDTFPTDPVTGDVVGGNQQCLNAAGTQALKNQLANFGCFVSGSAVLTPPLYGNFGNQARNLFRGPAFRNWDMSISKRWKLKEQIELQLRGEFFNILNHPNFDVFTIPTDLSDATFGTNDVGTIVATPDVGAANPVIGSGGSRHIQLGAKIIW